MLRSLQVRNYVLIDSLDIEFPAGLVIITGATGAGKSILLGALSLAMGAKADSSMIGEAADKCIVEAVFSVGDDPAIRAIFEEEGLEWDGGGLTVRRVIGKSGRSRSFINDEPVQVGVLSALSSRLIDIHGQQQTRLLDDNRFQLSLLDHYAGDALLLDDCRETWNRLSALRAEHGKVTAALKEISLRRDYDEAMLARLEAAHLVPGELEELDARQKQLANAEEIKGTLYQVENLFSGSEDQDGIPSLDSALKEASRLLSRIVRYVPAAETLAERVESSRLELGDILGEVSSLEASTNVSEDELRTVEERMSLLYDLMSRHGCHTVEELIAERDRLSGEVSGSGELQERADELLKEIASEELHYDEVSARLHEARAAVLDDFSASVESLVRSLELDRAVFRATLSDAAPGPSGRDSATYLFSASGREPDALSKIASGGERSRIMLCLKAIMARYANMPTMIFDEIDTGVSGSAADRMGSMICRMGEDMQVFAITHLPQVAAKGRAHYLVSKEISADGRAVSTIRPVSGEERVMEVARMLSGSSVTPQAIANARTLFGEQG